jgi:acetyltransferase-like isoleucine patch superfamily enzyme
VKRLARGVFLVPALVEYLRYRISRRFLGEERAFLGLTERLARRTGFPGVYLRAATYHLVLRDCSRDTQIGFGTVFSKPAAMLGDHVYIGRYCSLGWVHIEKDVMLADFVSIPSGGHAHRLSGATLTPPREMENRYEVVRVGQGTWVGSQSVILATVGRFCIVGAGSVVTKPIADFSIATGAPARVIGTTADQVAAVGLGL